MVLIIDNRKAYFNKYIPLICAPAVLKTHYYVKHLI